MPIRVIEDFYSRNTVVEVPVIEEFFPGIFKARSALYVGVRPLGWGGCPDPNSLAQAIMRIAEGIGWVEGVEVWPRYCERLRAERPSWLARLWQRDICELQTRLDISPRRFQLVVWWHGPEHAPNEKAGLLGLANCECLSYGHVLLGAPWPVSGNSLNPGFEGDPENPHEGHGWILTPEKLDALGYTVIALNCRRPEEKDRSPSGHLIGVKEIA